MFENLSDRLEGIYKKLKGRGILKEADVDEALREIRVALIEADASLPVIKDFLAPVREKAVGQEVLKSLTPGHQMVKIVNDELTLLIGDEFKDIQFATKPPTVILMAGLQGSGKTTTVGKLAKRFKEKGKSCLLVPADVYRPAAIEQLHVLGRDLGVAVFEGGEEKDPIAICKKALDDATDKMSQVVIIDTAGRQQIDEELMDELKRIKETVQPQEILFVADAMMGQQSAEIAKTFNDAVGIDGVVLTKMDGDARGGAALSIPGAGKLKGLKVDNKAFVQIEAIINSMTPKERLKHNIINASRKRRIAQGSGTRVNDINKLLKQFVQMQKMMKKVSRGGGLNFGSLMGGGGFLGR